MRADALPWLGALELAGLIRDRAVSPVEVAEAVLARIERLNTRLNAFCLVAHESARAAAREAEIAVMKGEPIGPLCGVPVSVKDVLPASGQGPIGVGTDGGGSVRIPASFCGLFGLKPSWGRVPNHRGFPGWERLSQTGPITRSVRDAAAVLDVIAGGDDRDPESLPGGAADYVGACDDEVKGLHVAWSPDLGYARVEPEVLRLCEEAAAQFESLGCHVEVVSPGWESPEAAFGTIVSAQLHAPWGDRLPQAEPMLDPSFVKLLRRGGGVTAREYLDAQSWARTFWLEVHGFLARFDLLLTPTVAVPPFAVGEPPPREIAGEPVTVLGWMPFTYPFNLTGQPAASVPVGVTARGLPVGLQIVGRRHADRAVLAAAAAYEAACPWAERRPPVE